MAGEETVDVRQRVRDLLEAHWRPEGFTAPNPDQYPFQWLWDSCFHAVLWAHLGDERAVTELASVFRWQAPSGFVPHVSYDGDPGHQAAFWGRWGCSALTQPPLYGHAVAELARRGVDVPDEVVERARQGLAFLLGPRRGPDGLVAMCHPWESGADDSPRWDSWCPGGFDPDRWYDAKGALFHTVHFGSDGSPIANPSFRCAGAGFNALVAFAAHELGDTTGDGDLVADATDLAAALDREWDGEVATWVDSAGAPDGGRARSSRVRTLDGLLPALVTPSPDRATTALDQLLDDDAFAGPFGPASVDRREPAFDPSGYWRGSVWPQLAYLLWLAARRRDRADVATALAAGTRRGAVASGFAEHWHTDQGTGLGAVPQSWAGLVLLMDED